MRAVRDEGDYRRAGRQLRQEVREREVDGTAREVGRAGRRLARSVQEGAPVCNDSGKDGCPEACRQVAGLRKDGDSPERQAQVCRKTDGYEPELVSCNLLETRYAASARTRIIPAIAPRTM